MISLIIDIIKQIAGLVKHRKQSKRQLFIDHIDPIYQNVKIINGQYTALFEKLRKDFSNTDVPIKTAILNFNSHRKEDALLRKEIFFTSDTIKDSKLPVEIREFCGDICEMLSVRNNLNKSFKKNFLPPILQPATRATNLMADIVYLLRENIRRKKKSYRTSCITIIDWYQKNLSESFETISRKYANLKIDYLK
jgi:hypothetical protein